MARKLLAFLLRLCGTFRLHAKCIGFLNKLLNGRLKSGKSTLKTFKLLATLLLFRRDKVLENSFPVVKMCTVDTIF